MRNFLYILLTVTVCNITRLAAQIIPFQNFTVKNGLPSNIIYDIEQDHQGYLWFATQAGAVRFDGYNFITYSIENGLPDNNIVDIFIDNKNRIWFATASGGLAVHANNRIKLYNRDNGLVSDYSIKVFEDKNENIWYISTEGISIIRSERIENYDGTNSEISGEIYCTYVSNNGTVWFSTFEHLFYFDTEIHTFKNQCLKGVTVREMVEDKTGSYWFATEGKGIVHISKTDTSYFNKNTGLHSNISQTIYPLDPDTMLVTTSFPGGLYKIVNNHIIRRWEEDVRPYVLQQVLVDHRNRIWLKTFENGLILLDKNKISKLDEKNNLVHNQIQQIFEDRNGNIWIATMNGLSRYGKIIFQIYNENFIVNDINVQSIANIDQKLYIGTYRGLNILVGNKIIQQFDHSNGLPKKAAIVSILPVSKDDLWLGTYSGPAKLHNNQIQYFPDPIFNKEDGTPEWATDLQMVGTDIYCATSKGLVKFDGKQYKLFNTSDGLANNNIWSIKKDSENNIWCATVNGLSIFDGRAFHNYDTVDGLPHYYCNDIAFDHNGLAWVATDRGLSKVRLNSSWKIECINIDKSKGLGSDIVFSVIVDKLGYIWAGHNFGLDRIDPVNYHVTHYGSKEGFLPVETSLGAVTLASGSDLWFGTVGGAVRYIRENDYIYTDPPLTYITKIKFYNDTSSIFRYATGVDSVTGLPEGLSLPYNKNNLVFNYVGLHYTIIEKNQYKYFLEGYDNDWTPPTNSIETTPYRKIPPGKYTFKLLAANCDGIWTEKPAEFSFEIRPPFYRTWWFYIIEFVAATTALLIIIRLRERKLRYDKIVLTQKVKERTIEIEKQRDQIVLQKKEITDSIVYARKIQSSVLPEHGFIDKLLHDYFILFKPRDIVSGDFYWVNQFHDQVILVAADCTGHGVPGAFMSMLGVTTLNEIINSRNIDRAGKILDTLRDHLIKTLGQTGREDDAKDGMDMALCIIDFKNKKLQYAGAYNPLIHVRNKESSVYKADKMPVGMHLGDMPPFTTHEIGLRKGDCIYIFSDGYADQFGGPEGKKFKSVHFNELLVEISTLTMSEQKIRLNETIVEWMGINEQVDDILVIGVRV